MSRDTTALPPLLVPQAIYDALEAHRAVLKTALGPVASRTWVLAQTVDVGLRDLLTELREHAGVPDGGSGATPNASGTMFFAPSPPRGSRWTNHAAARGASARPAGGPQGAPAGFVRLTTMIVDRRFVDAIDEVRRAFDRARPGLVASRAALMREALARGLAAYEQEREQHGRMRRLLEASPFPPAVAQIPLAALFAPSERPAATVTPSISQSRAKRPAKRSRARRTKRVRARASAGSGDSDDGEPPPPQPHEAPSVARRWS